MFGNAVQPLLESLGSELTVGYLDDLTLGGLQNQVAKDVQRVIAVADELGLTLNISKCELIANTGQRPTAETVPEGRRW